MWQASAPNVVSYTLAMEACLHGGQWNTSLEVLNEMIMRGVRLDSKACLTAIEVRHSQHCRPASIKARGGRKLTGE